MVEGEYQRGLGRLSRRYAAVGKVVVTLVVLGLGLPVAPVPALAVGFAAGVVLTGAAPVAGSRFVVAVDVLLAGVACLTQVWTVPADALTNGHGWTLVGASFTAVVAQWATRPLAGCAGAVLPAAAHVVGAAVIGPATLTAALPLALWICAEAALSRLLWSLVRRGAVAADEAVFRAEDERIATEVLRAVREDERRDAATLHDTAATTLLMVGLGQVCRADRWLARQLPVDLGVIRGEIGGTRGAVDLAEVLGRAASSSRVNVDVDVPPGIVVPADLGATLSGCVREALNNVARHASAPSAKVVGRADGHTLVVEVRDEGRGFDSSAVPPSRRGIAGSIVDRMHDAGGRASVISSPGRGTLVRLVHDRA